MRRTTGSADFEALALTPFRDAEFESFEEDLLLETEEDEAGTYARTIFDWVEELVAELAAFAVV